MLAGYASWLMFGGAAIAAFLVFSIILSLIFRRVVDTNKVHIVQSKKSTKSYGKDSNNGNTYYEWPASWPFIGVKVIELPVSNFDLSLNGYTAYDQDRVPFTVDITAFFRISDTNLAAQRVSSIQELNDQLSSIVQGAVRTILASHDINRIMLERATFGEQFTEEVKESLAGWGVTAVKNMELMDIRDAEGSKVIENIMAKKKSEIERESREVVAQNKQKAETAEIEAQQAVDIRTQEAEQAVGERTAQKEKEVGIAEEQAQQEIKEQQRATAEKDMAVKKVNEVRQAEIDREKEVVKADEEKQRLTIVAEGELAAKQREADGIKAEGEARADAEKQMQMAPVMAQLELVKGIGENQEYLNYLATVEAIAAQKQIGTEQAQALQDADVKVIANSGNAGEGVNSVMDLFTSKGGTNLGAMIEALRQTPGGEDLLSKLIPAAKAAAPKPAAETPAPKPAVEEAPSTDDADQS